ncbi:MAG: Med9 domain-containing protein [Planctomycetota bacterium]|jgi:hypothetical protein
MSKTKRPSRTSGASGLLPVIDLTVVLVVGLLTIGDLTPALVPPPAEPQGSAQSAFRQSHDMAALTIRWRTLVDKLESIVPSTVARQSVDAVLASVRDAFARRRAALESLMRKNIGRAAEQSKQDRLTRADETSLDSIRGRVGLPSDGEAPAAAPYDSVDKLVRLDGEWQGYERTMRAFLDRAGLLDTYAGATALLAQVRRAIARVKQTTPAAVDADAAVAALEKQAVELRKKLRELKDLQAALGVRDDGLDELEKKRDALLKKLARSRELLANLKRRVQLRGVPVVKSSHRVRKHFDVMLKGNRVLPLDNRHFHKRRIRGGLYFEKKRGAPGMTLADALLDSSPLMKAIASESFRKTGQVRFFVHPDSFETFRAIRNGVAAKGAVWGWEPYDKLKIAFRVNGAEVPSQG